MIYRDHDVFISIYRTLNSSPPEKEHQSQKTKVSPPLLTLSSSCRFRVFSTAKRKQLSQNTKISLFALTLLNKADQLRGLK